MTDDDYEKIHDDEYDATFDAERGAESARYRLKRIKAVLARHDADEAELPEHERGFMGALCDLNISQDDIRWLVAEVGQLRDDMCTLAVEMKRASKKRIEELEAKLRENQRPT